MKCRRIYVDFIHKHHQFEMRVEKNKMKIIKKEAWCRYLEVEKMI